MAPGSAEQRAGRIHAGGLDLEVAFTPVEGETNDCINAAYSEKYDDTGGPAVATKTGLPAVVMPHAASTGSARAPVCCKTSDANCYSHPPRYATRTPTRPTDDAETASAVA